MSARLAPHRAQATIVAISAMAGARQRGRDWGTNRVREQQLHTSVGPAGAVSRISDWERASEKRGPCISQGGTRPSAIRLTGCYLGQLAAQDFTVQKCLRSKSCNCVQMTQEGHGRISSTAP